MKSLIEFLGLVFFTLALSLLIFSYQNEHINDEKSYQLKSFIIDVQRDEKFYPVFIQKLSEFAEDGKITNSEFDDLEDLYEQYKTSKIINDTTFADRKQQKSSAVQDVTIFAVPSFTTLTIFLLPLLSLIAIRVLIR